MCCILYQYFLGVGLHIETQAKTFMFVLHILHAKIVPCPFLTEVCFNKEDDHEET